MTDPITGKVVVITGASSGLGEATARLLAARGAKLVIAARRKDRLDALAKKLGGDTLAVETDVADRAAVQALANAAIERFGQVDVMLNNAGLMPLSALEKLQVDDWERMVDVNIKGVLYGIAAVLPGMIARKSGHIINVSSVAGHKVRATSAVYSATKHAVRALSDGLRQEMTPHGIRVTIISPGAVATELGDTITDESARANIGRVMSIAVPADSFARAVAYAIEQPDDLGINEILFRPVAQEY
jgi:NADP-dependent 3-hydroxy acid dehydrogenase YdfG